MAPKKKVVKEEEVVKLGPQVADGENVFGVCHLYASYREFLEKNPSHNSNQVQH